MITNISEITKIYKVSVETTEKFPQLNLEPKFKLVDWFGADISGCDHRAITAALYVSEDNTMYHFMTTDVRPHSFTNIEEFNYYSMSKAAFDEIKSLIDKAKQLPQNLDNVNTLLNTIKFLKHNCPKRKIITSYKVNLKRRYKCLLDNQ